MTKKFPSQQMDRFNVRLPPGMRDEIARRAEKNNRSMNSEIIEMLNLAMAVRPSWAKDNELYLDDSGFGSRFAVCSSLKKYPDKNEGSLLISLREKLDEINELMNIAQINQNESNDETSE